jgi:hypothetical protein
MQLRVGTAAGRGSGAFSKPGVKRLFFLREPYDPSRGVFGSGRIISVPLSSLRPC